MSTRNSGGDSTRSAKTAKRGTPKASASSRSLSKVKLEFSELLTLKVQWLALAALLRSFNLTKEARLLEGILADVLAKGAGPSK